MVTIASIVGARPNFIKLKILYEELSHSKARHIIIHTGQHYDYEMSSVFFEEFDLPKPDYYLDVGPGTHGQQTGEMLKRVEEVLMKEIPNLVIVYGDTNTTLAGALAAVKLGIPVAHVEAGLRSGEKYMAEEINRLLVDHVSELLFAPTRTSLENLRRESVKGRIILSGDVMLDLYLKFKDKIDVSSKGDFILLTVHRAENVDNYQRLKDILETVTSSGYNVVFPIHPRTKMRVREFGLEKYLRRSNLEVLDPLSYMNFLRLMGKSRKVVTDSGGVQKEAYFMGKPCIVLRKRTEWIEPIEEGLSVLVGWDKRKVREAIEFFEPRKTPNLERFGGGMAGKRIHKEIAHFLNL